MKLFKTILFLTLMHATAQAQFVTTSKRVADVYFQNKEYYAAAEYYKKALKISSDSSGFLVPYGFENKMKEDLPKKDDYEYNVYQLATSLRLYKNYRDAQAWYAIAVNFTNPKYNLSTYWYAETLRANQQYNEAILSFKKFLDQHKQNDEYTRNAKVELQSCHFSLYETTHPRLQQLTRLSNTINSEGSNYTPYLFQNKFYFTSSRPVAIAGKSVVLEDERDNSKVVKKETPFLNAIYEVDGNPTGAKVSIEKIEPKSGNVESAAPAIHPNGKIRYITSWSAKGTRKIYQQNVISADNKQWSEPLELSGQVNVEKYNSIQPSITSDGKYFMFSSDRPGGSGKYDLWYCQLLGDNTMGPATNMGSLINTREDESAAYYNPKMKRLIYSSNGKVGIGGLDFYESIGDFSQWTEPENLGLPYNSSKDDVYFTPLNEDGSEGYISSDRSSLCCLEIFKVSQKFLTINGKILDCKTQLPLSGAIITLTDSVSQMKDTTDAIGMYSIKLTTNRLVKLKVEKEDYFTKVLSYDYNTLSKTDSLFSPELCLEPLIIDKPIVLKDIYYDFDSADLKDESKVVLDDLYKIMIDNEKIEIELSAHTDNKGVPIYNLDLSERRAKACVEYLVSKGIPAARMTSKGYGLTMPVAPNTFRNGKDNPSGRQLNRRTEFKVTKK
jgi:OOP family OmpA-OmpF porin